MKRFVLPFLLTLICSTPFLRLNAQEQEPEKLTHWLTPGEKLRLNEIGKNFQETDPPVGPIRNVAEYDRMQGALVRYPFGIPVELIKEMANDVMVTTIVASTSQQNTVLQIYQQNGVNTDNCNFLIAPSNSYWTRDYGPWFETDSSNNVGIIDFPYNRPRPYDDEIPKLVAGMLGIPWYGMNVIHTGGNYMTDGLGISSSTDLVWSENPTQTHEEIAQKVHDYLGIENYQVLPDPNNTYIDHIDCWGKFLAPDKILIRKVPPTHPQYDEIENMAAYWATQICSYGYYYHVYRVSTPNNEPYTNSIILNNKALIPYMNSNLDDSAKMAYEAAMPGYEVIGFIGQSSTPWESTDALHCRVMGIADLGILYIRHIPISGAQPAEQDYIVNADIIACSDSTVYPDSVLIWYRVNTGAFQPVHMVHTTGESYTGTIPKQAGGSTVQYYLYAADASGRNAMEPIMGPADPFTFTTVYTNLTARPDTLWFRTIADMGFGKHTYLHNYTGSAINLEEVQLSSLGPVDWYVDSLTSWTLPYSVAAADSFYVLVRCIIPLGGIPEMTFLKDSMKFVTPVGTQYVMIMLNDSLLMGTGDTSPGDTQAFLGHCYPNPMQGNTTIPFTLTEPGNISLQVFDLNGKVVRTLVAGNQGKGPSQARWNSLDDRGALVPAGIYICRLASEQGVQTRRIVVIR